MFPLLVTRLPGRNVLNSWQLQLQRPAISYRGELQSIKKMRISTNGTGPLISNVRRCKTYVGCMVVLEACTLSGLPDRQADRQADRERERETQRARARARQEEIAR